MKKLLFLTILAFGLMSYKPVQLLKTQLQVFVVDGNGNVVSDAEVKLYESQEDFNNDKTAVDPVKTNAKGKVRIIGLKEIEYFIEVKKGDKDNSLGADKTAVLTKGKINKINVIIAYNYIFKNIKQTMSLPGLLAQFLISTIRL